MKYVVADFESTPQKVIHSISFIPVEVNRKKQWVSHGRHRDPEFKKNNTLTRGHMRTIFIKESFENPYVYLHDRTVNKIGKTLMYGGEDICILPYREALLEFIQCVHERGDGNWLAHAMDNELDILQTTDTHFGTGLFPKSLRHFPDESRLDGWFEIAKVCTQQLLTYRCPDFFRAYAAWMTMNGMSHVQFSSRLEDFTRFVRNDREYTQRHIAPADVMDLCDVLSVAHPPIDGKSFIVSKPMANWSDIQTKTFSASFQSTS